MPPQTPPLACPFRDVAPWSPLNTEYAIHHRSIFLTWIQRWAQCIRPFRWPIHRRDAFQRDRRRSEEASPFQDGMFHLSRSSGRSLRSMCSDLILGQMRRGAPRVWTVQ